MGRDDENENKSFWIDIPYIYINLSGTSIIKKNKQCDLSTADFCSSLPKIFVRLHVIRIMKIQRLGIINLN